MNNETPIHCNTKMVWYTVGAPGTGGGWWCPTCDHMIAVIPTRILTPGEVK
jgi:hypothetical protein